jgi:hypothetical protein
LKKLNLGITTWHKYDGGEDDHGDFWGRYIGYAKVGGKWGLALSEASGNVAYGIDSENSWLFNDAPRAHRIESVEHIPTLLQALVKDATKAAAVLQAKTKQVRDIAAIIDAPAPPDQGQR